MTITPSLRTRNISSFLVLDMLRRAQVLAAQGRAVTRMEAGQPFCPLPRPAIDAAVRAVRSHPQVYTEARGTRALRDRLASHYADTYHQDVDPDRIFITAGSSAAFILAFLTLFDPRARVGIVVPGYPAYRSILRALDLQPVDIRVGSTSSYRLTLAALEQAGDLDGLMVASPANPTGAMLDPAALAAIAGYCREKGIRLVSDELYHGITFGTVAPATALAMDDTAVVINSFSKYYAMTGWRLGWMVVPDGLCAAVEAMMQSLFIAAPTLSQLVALAVLDCRAELDAQVQAYRDNRDILINTLESLGVTDISPVDGAFYCYADLGAFTGQSVDFCEKVLEDTGLALTAGVDFDPVHGHRFVRFSFAAPRSDIEKGCKILQDILKS